MQLSPLQFEELPGWDPRELAAVWPTYLASCRALTASREPLRAGVRPSGKMLELAKRALDIPNDPAVGSTFLIDNFKAFEVLDSRGVSEGFVTGYYEPEIDGSETPDARYSAPILARPDDLIDMRGERMKNWDPRFEGARRTNGATLEPYPTREQIENGAIDAFTRPIVWLRDHVEVFFAQVQGSARVRLPDGKRKRLVYAGRNGRPYSSIGKILIGQDEIRVDEMSLARCKAWLRANGLREGDRGRNVLQMNESYVFFRLDEDDSSGPVGGQGVPLTPMQSIAVDRTVWPYGTPIWIGSDLAGAGLGTGPTGRLMIAQDTGSAIVGPARGDLFIGSGDRAGEIAGLIRHSARFIVLAPDGMGEFGGA